MQFLIFGCGENINIFTITHIIFWSGIPFLFCMFCDNKFEKVIKKAYPARTPRMSSVVWQCSLLHQSTEKDTVEVASKFLVYEVVDHWVYQGG